MPAKSKAQQRFFGMVHALQKGDGKPSDYSKEVQKVAKDMPKKAAKDYASTDTKNLPDKKEEIELLIRREIKDMLKESESDIVKADNAIFSALVKYGQILYRIKPEALPDFRKMRSEFDEKFDAFNKKWGL